MLENEANGDSMESQLLQTGVDIIGDKTATATAAVRGKCMKKRSSSCLKVNTKISNLYRNDSDMAGKI